MSRIETVYAVSDPQPSVDASVSQLAQRLDKNLKDLVTIFEQAGEQLWTVEPASHTVTPVPASAGRRPALFGRRDDQGTRYVASALLMVTSQPRID